MENKQQLIDNIVIEFNGMLNGNKINTKVEMVLSNPLRYGSDEHSKNVRDILKLFNNIDIK